MSWADEELSGINLGDNRLNKRSVKILAALGGNPSISIPAACNGYHETKAAYRYFDNPDVKAANILRPHNEATFKRIADEKIILCVQDTTEVDFTGQKENAGIGFLNAEARRGLFLHPTLAMNARSNLPRSNTCTYMATRKIKTSQKRRRKKNGQKITD